MIVTTAGRVKNDLIYRAKKIANSYNMVYVEINGRSIQTLKDIVQEDIVIVGTEGLFVSSLNSDQKLFFHPNLAMVRAKRMLQNQKDPLVEIAKLKEGMSMLDCTLGLASDSIIASIAVGFGGSIYGLEGNPLIYLLTKEGLSTFVSGNQLFDKAMRKINVINKEHYSYMKNAETDSVDIVYFDPMFDKGIKDSTGINSIRDYALRNSMTYKVIEEAKRVARKRVILKDHWKSDRFIQFGFTQHKRKTALFHYGVIELT
ncbi:class I SAM-dependent methyltransferase [Gracilibacillus xinjiangensis]|uniref:Class I SAM-dependent methyltransferase n=1 Tax=Gracilibacillus xinjiangensis TaxID=1193282 RepID=A0ABV8WVQ9_9BACI